MRLGQKLCNYLYVKYNCKSHADAERMLFYLSDDEFRKILAMTDDEIGSLFQKVGACPP